MTTYDSRYRSMTDIGCPFGMSGVTVGKVLDSAGLRDSVTRAPTTESFTSGVAKRASMADGTPFFIWDRRKVTPLLSSISDRMEPSAIAELERKYAVTRAVRSLKRAVTAAEYPEGLIEEKFGYMFVEEAIAEIPNDIYEEVLTRVFGDEAASQIETSRVKRKRASRYRTHKSSARNRQSHHHQ